MKKEITLKEAQEHINEWGIDSDNFIQKNYQQYLVNGEHSDNTMDTYYYHLDRLRIVVEAGLKAIPIEPPVSPKTVEEEELEYNKLFVELYKNFIAYKWFTDGHFENEEETQKRKNEIKRLITVFRC